jgi:hypothetical protein
MDTDVTPKIVSMVDDTELLLGGRARHVTRVRYVVGNFGPFEHVFERGPSRHEIERVLNEKRDTLTGLV